MGNPRNANTRVIGWNSPSVFLSSLKRWMQGKRRMSELARDINADRRLLYRWLALEVMPSQARLDQLAMWWARQRRGNSRS